MADADILSLHLRINTACKYLKKIEERRNSSFPEGSNPIQALIRELRFLRTFFLSMEESWNHGYLADDSVQLELLITDVGNRVSEAAQIFCYLAVREEVQLKVDSVVSCLLEEVEIWKEQVGRAYHLCLSYLQSISPIRVHRLMLIFIASIIENFEDLLISKADLDVALKDEIRVLEEKLSFLGKFIRFIAVKLRIQNEQTRNLFNYTRDFAFKAAMMSYFFWIGKSEAYQMDDFYDLQLSIRDATDSSIATYLAILEIANQLPSETPVCCELTVSFCDFLLEGETTELIGCNTCSMLSMDGRLRAPCEGLRFLRTYLLDPLGEETVGGKVFLTHIQVLVIKAASFIWLFHFGQLPELSEESIKEINLQLLELVGRILLIKAEVLLEEILNHHKASLMVQMKDRLEILHEGLRFLTTFVMDMPGYSEDGKLLFSHIEAVVSELASIVHSFCVNGKAEQIFGESELLLKLISKIRLIKAELLLNELIHHQDSSMAPMKDKFKIIQEGLKFLRMFLMDPLHNYREEGIISQSGDVAREATALVCWFLEKRMDEDVATEMNLMVSLLTEKIKCVQVEVISLQTRKSSQAILPRIHRSGFLDFLLENMTAQLNNGFDLTSSVDHECLTICKGIEFVRSLLSDITDQHIEHDELKKVVAHVNDVSFTLEYAMNSFLAKDGVCSKRLWLSYLLEEIKLIKINIMEIHERKSLPIGIQPISNATHRVTSQAHTPSTDEVVVGVKEEAELIINQLTRGSTQLSIVSIVGMAGLGKTTLARKIYSDPEIISHFNVRAWCTISQVYAKRELLLDILGDIVELTDQVHNMKDEDLAEKLRKLLKGKRYLIVMDDIWDIGAWDDLQEAFPNDQKVGSRILFTSRVNDVALNAILSSHSHPLRLLSGKESWELLQAKLFQKEGCPKELIEVGEEIAKNCKGLPLAIVIIAGLLAKTDKKWEWWKQVAENLSSLVVGDSEEFMDVLELSYKYLPDYLKPCFLYFGAFPEDKEVPVWNLLCLWVAEGLIKKPKQKSIDDIARKYLMELVGRNLVMVAKRRSNGGVKACYVHDLLHKFCRTKAEEEIFMSVYDSDSHPNSHLVYQQHRLSIYSTRKHFILSRPSGPSVHSLLFFATATSDENPRWPYNISFICCNFKLLWVLNLEFINMGDSFPSGIELLVHLRYLAVRGNIKSIPPSVANLLNLETFLVKGLRGEVILPITIWNMKKLRHVHVKDRSAFDLDFYKIGELCLFDNLDTFSSPSLSYGAVTEKILKSLPGLRKLKCIFLESWDSLSFCNRFPVLDFLSQLESLKVLYHGKLLYPCKFSYPSNLKKLTLSKFRLPWSEISSIGSLPNLEVLKLLFRAFEGKQWDVNSEEFCKLRYLKLDSLNIEEWNASNECFPCLHQLVLKNCKKLGEVPIVFGEISTLQMIQVRWCSSSVAKSVKGIQEEQVDMGNEDIEVFIHPPDC